MFKVLKLTTYLGRKGVAPELLSPKPRPEGEIRGKNTSRTRTGKYVCMS